MDLRHSFFHLFLPVDIWCLSDNLLHAGLHRQFWFPHIYLSLFICLFLLASSSWVAFNPLVRLLTWLLLDAIFSPRNWIFLSCLIFASLAPSIVFLRFFCDLASLLPSVNCPLFKLMLDLLWTEVLFWLRLLQFPRDHLVTYRSI